MIPRMNAHLIACGAVKTNSEIALEPVAPAWARAVRVFYGSSDAGVQEICIPTSLFLRSDL